MGGLRDYEQWHRGYDDPASGLAWRLGVVQRHIRAALDQHAGPMRVVSVCAGDGRDVLGVLSQRADAVRVQVTLIELHPGIAERARQAAVAAGLSKVEVRTADAGNTNNYLGAVPADLVLMVGVFGNINDEDLTRTIDATPGFCAPAATLVWSRGVALDDRNDQIRAQFARTGFSELDYAHGGSGPALGSMRYDGEPTTLEPGQQLFTFVR